MTYYDEILEIVNPYDHVGGNIYIGGTLPDYSKFDYVICLTPDSLHYGRTGKITIQAPFNDTSELPPDKFIREIVNCVHRCVSLGTTYVHCSAGLNRSGMIVALVMIDNGWAPQKAVDYLRKLRSCSVLSNETFLNRVLLEPVRNKSI